MQKSQVEKYIEFGVITGATVRPPYAANTGFTIEFDLASGNADSFLRVSRGGEKRQFRTLDTAHKFLSKVGITDYRICT